MPANFICFWIGPNENQDTDFYLKLHDTFIYNCFHLSENMVGSFGYYN